VRNTILVGAAFAICIFPALLNGAPTQIPLLERAPTIDGVLGAGEWTDALHVTDFEEKYAKAQVHQTAVPPGQRTEAYLACTPSALCVAFRCFHDRMKQMVTAATKHDGPVWADDSVELFLDAHNTRFSYYHIIVNAAGVAYDAFNKAPRRADATWDRGVAGAGRLLTDGFSIEFTIPLSSLNLGLNRTGVVGVNFCRNVRYSVGRQACFGGYHDPASWRSFRLSQAGPVSFPAALEAVQWSALAGRNDLSGRVRNLAQTPIRLTGELAIAQGGKHQQHQIRLDIPPGKTAKFRATYAVTDQDVARFRLGLRNSQGREVLTAYRILRPRPIASVAVDTDVLLRGESPRVTVSLALTPASATEYAIRLIVRTPDGTEVFRQDVPPAARTRFIRALDLSQALPRADRLEIETVVASVRTGKEVLRAKTPLRVLPSPWAGADK